MKPNTEIMNKLREHLNDNTPLILLYDAKNKTNMHFITATDIGLLMNTEVFTLGCRQLTDKNAITGATLVPTTDGTGYRQYFKLHHVIGDAISYAKLHCNEAPVLIFDEFDKTTAEIASAILSIAPSRRIGPTKLPNNLRIIIVGEEKDCIDKPTFASAVSHHTWLKI